MTPVLSPSSRAEQVFNDRHIAGRSVVEKVFGLLKSRFRYLHKSGGCLLLKPTKACKVAEACTRLYHFCLDKRVPLAEQDVSLENEVNDNYICQIPPNRNGSDSRQSLINLFL
ncbi:putative nuclease HARBI1 [Ruditapes philippinarum]|uniref:putative nuclease HARBI1 n=1 Tax=Ruditapes philippinarum TaxID=129788 RepID=UPI00295C0FE4|nr:putative nuclease HARBI1 [Ruditapes philippinarum]